MIVLLLSTLSSEESASEAFLCAFGRIVMKPYQSKYLVE